MGRGLGWTAVLLALLGALPCGAQCTGDCDGDGAVAINELVSAVGISLGTLAPSVCPAADGNGDGAVAINELVSAVGHSLSGCPTPAATPTPTSTATATASATATPTATVTPTATPNPAPVISFFGLATAAEIALEPTGTDAAGRPIFERPVGFGFFLVVEARRGLNGVLVGDRTFNHLPGEASFVPDLQVLVSRGMGNASAVVCDFEDPGAGGVPGGALVFDDTLATADRLNDLGCRFRDGEGLTVGRRFPRDACTRDPLTMDFDFTADSNIQFCAIIAADWAFPPGDTLVAARVLDDEGTPGAVREIVLRVAQ